MAQKEFTILLLGESGVGKSTFINAFVNYMTYETLNEARDQQPVCLIPTAFTMSDTETYELKTITFGPHEDPNENITDSTLSATKYPRCYKLPNNTRVDVIFKYCLFGLLSHLNKSAADNILFLFTNTRSTQYAPGESGPILLNMLNQIRDNPPNVNIPYSKKTIYCFDNESFRYLVATVHPNNMQFSDDLTLEYEESWASSVRECDRLLERIVSLQPHKILDTLSLNNAKHNILLLIKPLADIAKHIADNQHQCEIHKRRVREFTGTIEQLREEMYVPSVDIKTKCLDKPKTVCTEGSCCEHVVVNGQGVIPDSDIQLDEYGKLWGTTFIRVKSKMCHANLMT
ncbi:unnamed protein product [Oppiella nova]|uniref:G domain-containing protein n=1 Tax=Oppiella nova TaxID=334625 RepID=A0A7R9MBI6_9ACAR|nr:unnamed protein product [Oppiella nova]CAG2173054.1 unnamed protein product [Oppiella nova]